jgi:type I restriction enzyme S subunit
MTPPAAKNSPPRPGFQTLEETGAKSSKGWKMVRLGEITETRVDKTGPTGREFTYIDIGSVELETKRIAEPKVLLTSQAPSRAKQILKHGDVLVSMTRPNRNAVALIPPEFDGAIGSTGFHVFRVRDAEPGFIFYAVQTNDFIDALCEKVQGALYPAVRPRDISFFNFFLPPLAEQKQIVAEIEKQFTRLEAGVSALKRVQANLKRYRAAVLKAACEGRLVPTEAELHKVGRGVPPSRPSETAHSESSPYLFETGEELLERILAECRNNGSGRGKYKEPAAPDTANLPPLPEGWTWASLDQICIKITDGTHHSPKNSANGDFAYITSKNIREFRLDLTDVTDIDKATHDEIYARCDVQLNDVLYVKDGANTGLAAKNTIEGPFSLLSSVGVFRPISFINPDYLVAYLNSRETRDRMLSQIAGVAITRLTLSKLKISAIAVPPLAEQVRIVAEVERRLSVVEKLEAIISANLQRAALLRQSILQKAFSGELAGHDVSCPSSSPNRRDGYDG